MVYTPQTWQNGPAGGTPISAEALSHIESGLQDASLVAQQALASVTGNFTGTASDDRLAVLAVPQRFTGIDATGATDSRAGLQLAVAATPTGGTLVIPPGTYQVNGRINVTNAITISMYGATVVNNSTQEWIVFTGGFETVYNVSTATDTTMTGSAGEVLNTTTITLSGSPAWSTGDIVKLVADNNLPDPQGVLKPGQHMHVVSASGTTVVLAGRFRDPLTTSVRVARKKRIDFVLLGGSSTATASLMSATAVGFAQIKFLSAIRPIIRDHQVINAAGPAVQVFDCFQYVVDHLFVDYAKNGTTVDNTYGYGVNDQSSEFGLVFGLRANRVRHGYTCNGGDATTLDALSDYGRSYGTIVANGTVYGSSQGAYDTHGNGRRIMFVNCSAIDCYSGFGFRGIEMIVIGGFVLRSHEYGVSCFATGGGKSYGHFFGGGLVIDGCGKEPIAVTTNSGGTFAGIKETNPVYVDGVTCLNVAAGKKALYAQNSTVYVGRVNTTVVGVTNTNSDVLPMPTLAV